MNKKLIFGILSFLIAFSVQAQTQDSLTTPQIETDSIEYNRVVLDTNVEKAILIGYCTEEGISSSPIFSNYYSKEYNNYTPKLDFLETLTDDLNNVRIVIIFGSWCPDSQREVPRFMRILDELNYPLDSLSIICVNRLKTVPDVDIKRYMVEFVPTIIFYRDNFEIGRIVESPMETLEDDMASILMKTF